MKLELRRYSILLIPENPVDEAYLEEVIGLRSNGPGAVAKRINVIGGFSFAYAEVKRAEQTTIAAESPSVVIVPADLAGSAPRSEP